MANEEIINLLYYQSRFNVFSPATTPPVAGGDITAIELVYEEPQWRGKIQQNIAYLKNRLTTLSFDYDQSKSAIFPIMIRDEEKIKR
ncbi:MAG: hypothetical protein ABI045_04930 [Flavobacteriales bacterium]